MYTGSANEKFFSIARKAAEMSNFYRCHTGCVIVYKGDIISSGYNQNKTHPLQKVYNKERYEEDSTPHYMHAEIHALSSVINDTSINWKKVHIYLYRISKKNVYALARPCPACMKLIHHLGIRHIHYTTNNGYAHEILNERGIENEICI